MVTIYAGDADPFEGNDHANCGSLYAAYANADRVFVNRIGWTEGEPISFRAAGTLDLLGSYLVFLNKTEVESDRTSFGRDVRTARCMGSGVRLVPLLLETEFVSLDAIFQEWRVYDPEDPKRQTFSEYFLAHDDLREFLQSAGGNQSAQLQPISLTIQRFWDSQVLDAFASKEILEAIATVGCAIRDPSVDSLNELQIAKCEDE